MAWVLGVVGAGFGVALALGAFGFGVRHWAVRVLCGAVGVVALPAWIVAALWSGRESLPAAALWSVACWFVLAAGVLLAVRAAAGIAWIAAGGRRRAAIAAGVVLACGVVWVLLVCPAEMAPDAQAAVPDTQATVSDAQAPDTQATVSDTQAAAVPEAHEVNATAADCACAVGAVCAGPRGGRYCLRPDGGKRSLP